MMRHSITEGQIKLPVRLKITEGFERGPVIAPPASCHRYGFSRAIHAQRLLNTEQLEKVHHMEPTIPHPKSRTLLASSDMMLIQASRRPGDTVAREIVFVFSRYGHPCSSASS